MTKWIALVALALELAAVGVAAEPTRRLALMIGVNDGGRDRVRLQYAVSDAITLAGSMQELGGVDPADMAILKDITVEALDAAFDRLYRHAAEAKKNGERIETLIYYSGHADERGLLLRGRHYPFPRFRARVDGLPAEVRIAVVDACASGALTKRKGGRVIPAFLADVSRQTSGYAFLTSSSSDEAAQESDRIRASFFSHYFNTGLRGAADASLDGRITLNEAYNYAYRETLARTESSAAGPQHASYDMSMSGSGDVVMTDLRRSTSTLSLPDSASGRFFIRDMRERLIAEVQKSEGKPLRFAIEPGQYQIHWHNQGRIQVGNLILKKGDEAQVFQDVAWKNVSKEVAVARGDAGFADTTVARQTNEANTSFESREWSGNIDDMTEYQLLHQKVVHDFRGTQLTWGYNRADRRFEGEQFALLMNSVGSSLKGLQVGGLFNVTHGQMRGGQVSGFANFGHDDVRGLQLTSGFNIAQSMSQGVQVSDFFNYVGGSGRGVQFSPVANWTGGSMAGMQFAMGLNYAGSQFKGLQGFGFLNWAGGPVDGYQIGFINIAHSYHSGSPVGLFNFVGKGVWRGETWVDETGMHHFGLLTGARHMRTRIALGHKPLSSREIGSGTLEAAGHWSLDSAHTFFIEPGLMSTVIGLDQENGDDSDVDFLNRFRLSLGAQIVRNVAISGGLSWAWLITLKSRAPFTGEQWGQFSFHGDRMHMWPGMHLALQVGTRL